MRFITCVVAWSVPSFAMAQATFQALGDLPGGPYETYVSGVSADGKVVVGSSIGVNGGEAVYWTKPTGLVALGDLPGGIFLSTSVAANATGSVIVGVGRSANGQEAFRWKSGVMTPLGDLAGGPFSSTATGVSADGTIVVGVSETGSGSRAFRWTFSDGMIVIPPVSGDAVGLGAGVSASGEVVVGLSGPPSQNKQGFWWSEDTGSVGIGENPSAATAVSADGRYIVGYLYDDAYRWSSDGGIETLGSPWARAYAVSADGRTIVGGDLTCHPANCAGFSFAFLWTPEKGVQDLKTLLTTTYGLNLKGWTLKEATGVSADGRTIVGNGTFEYTPGFLRAEGWVVRLPGPCKPDCEEDGDLDAFDFLCFQARFAAGDLWADFELDGDLDVFDFLAFQASVAAGCQ